jgi:glycosyltransferase involved in cell wall biosynthesis
VTHGGVLPQEIRCVPIAGMRVFEHAGGVKTSVSGHDGSRDERIRLMRFVTLFGLGGIERQFVSLGLQLDARFAVEYGCLRRLGRRPDEADARGAAVFEYPVRHLFGLGALWQQLRLARHIGSTGAQIVHAHNFHSNLFAVPAAWLAGAPVIIATIRDSRGKLTWLQRFAHRVVCRLADRVLVHTESVRDWLVAEGYPPSKIVLMHHAADQSAHVDGRRPSVLDELGPPGVPVVAVLAKLEAGEGIEDFIDAAAIVSWNRPDVRFLIVPANHGGDPATSDASYRQAVVDRIHRLGLREVVLLAGDDADSAALVPHVAVAVLASERGNSPDALIGAMAAGVPVVATRVENTLDLVEHDRTGLLVPPSDPQDLAEAIGRVLQEPEVASRLRTEARRTVRERFGWNPLLEATGRLYLDLLVRKAMRPDWRIRIGLARPAFEALRREGGRL